MEQPFGFSEKMHEWKILGQNEIVIEKKSFQIVTEMAEGRGRARVVERSKGKES